MPLAIEEQRFDPRYDEPIYRTDPRREDDTEPYSCPRSTADPNPAQQPFEAEVDAFDELLHVEVTAASGIAVATESAYPSERAPFVLTDNAAREQAAELLALLPEELRLLGNAAERLEAALGNRRSLRHQRVERLRSESADLNAILDGFADAPCGYTSSQLETRRTHLEKTLDAANDRIDAEERACDRDILALQDRLDETLREYLTAKQLLNIIQS